jgi:hypothetical protein
LASRTARRTSIRQFAVEEAVPLGARGALLTGVGIRVLRLTAHVIALGHDFGGLAHRQVQAGDVLLHPGVGRLVALHHRDRLDAAADDGVDALVHDHVDCLDDRLQPRVAVPVDGQAGRRHRQPGAQRGDARHVVPRGAVGLAAAEDDLADLRRSERGHLRQHRADAVGRQIVGAGQVERPAMRLRERRPGAGDDHGFSHGTPRDVS